MELSWATIQALADHKRGYRPAGSTKPEFKVEMWMLFPSGGLIRTLALDPEKLREADAERATRLFGTEAWRPIYDARRAGDTEGSEARDGYVNLMRWRLEEALGYEWTHPLEIKNLKGNPLYHMILATDNQAGTDIMGDLYTDAAKRIPQMRDETLAQQRAFQQERLFEVELEVQPYRYEAPWNPEMTKGQAIRLITDVPRHPHQVRLDVLGSSIRTWDRWPVEDSQHEQRISGGSWGPGEVRQQSADSQHATRSSVYPRVTPCASRSGLEQEERTFPQVERLTGIASTRPRSTRSSPRTASRPS